MRRGQSSRTAEYMALFRAIESARPPGRRLFHDPYAKHFLRPRLRLLVGLNRIPLIGSAIRRYADDRWPGVRSSGVGRTCFIDERLRAALDQGVDQIVILGAGFDCRALRTAGIEKHIVFEVDHPDTSAMKRRRLKRFAPSPRHVRYVATDFNEQQLARDLIAAGYENTATTFFIWEGVTNYLSEDAVNGTFRWISTAAAGSEVVFTYIHKDCIDKPESFEGTDNIRETLDRAGEPWTFGIHPDELTAFLNARGFELIQDLGANDYRARYLINWPGSQHGYEFYRIAHARVRKQED